MNTISCSFLGVEEKLTQLHQFLISNERSELPSIAAFLHMSTDDLNNYIQQCDFNHTLQQSCANLAKAVEVYNNAL